MQLSQDAIQECLTYGFRLMLTKKEILSAIESMTEEEFQKGAMYEILGNTKRRLIRKWQFKHDLRNEY